MISYVRGKLISTSNSSAIIETNGIGYEILVPQNVIEKAPPLGEECQLFTSFVIRENSQTLFGFLEYSSKKIFEVLLNISGVGPKMALALIGHLSIDQLQEAICHEDVNILKNVPGVGKKTAERLIVELKDKLPSLFPREPLVADGLSDREAPKSQTFFDAVSALINLGYQQYQAKKSVQQAVEESDHELQLPELITLALQIQR